MRCLRPELPVCFWLELPVVFQVLKYSQRYLDKYTWVPWPLIKYIYICSNYFTVTSTNTTNTSTTFGKSGIYFVGFPSSSLHQSTWSCLGRHLFSSFLSMLLDFPSRKAGQRKPTWMLDERWNPFNMQNGTKQLHWTITAVFMFFSRCPLWKSMVGR